MFKRNWTYPDIRYFDHNHSRAVIDTALAAAAIRSKRVHRELRLGHRLGVAAVTSGLSGALGYAGFITTFKIYSPNLIGINTCGFLVGGLSGLVACGLSMGRKAELKEKYFYLTEDEKTLSILSKHHGSAQAVGHKAQNPDFDYGRRRRFNYTEEANGARYSKSHPGVETADGCRLFQRGMALAQWARVARLSRNFSQAALLITGAQALTHMALTGSVAATTLAAVTLSGKAAVVTTLLAQALHQGIRHTARQFQAQTGEMFRYAGIAANLWDGHDLHAIGKPIRWIAKGFDFINLTPVKNILRATKQNSQEVKIMTPSFVPPRTEALAVISAAISNQTVETAAPKAPATAPSADAAVGVKPQLALVPPVKADLKPVVKAIAVTAPISKPIAAQQPVAATVSLAGVKRTTLIVGGLAIILGAAAGAAAFAATKPRTPTVRKPQSATTLRRAA